jgi:pimeloyl-ACP methyl ester carboxylesterase
MNVNVDDMQERQRHHREEDTIDIMNAHIPHSPLGSVNANGIEIAYDTFGSKDDEPILLIMGLGCQMVLWEDEFCFMLAEKGFYVIRFDNRDVGMSTKMTALGMPHIQALLLGKLSVGPYTILDMAKDAVGLLGALQIEKAHVIGVSMGGMIGQEIAITYPERLMTLTSIMSSTGNPLLPPPKKEAIEILFRPIPTIIDAFVSYFRDVWRVLSGPRFPMNDITAGRLGGETFRRGVDPAGNARQLAAIFVSGSRKERLASVKSPTLVIHGTQDPLVPIECGVDTAESIPGADLKIYDGMGHWLPPKLWIEIIGAIEGHVRRA